jgi:hypothetical protein
MILHEINGKLYNLSLLICIVADKKDYDNKLYGLNLQFSGFREDIFFKKKQDRDLALQEIMDKISPPE